MYEGSKDLVETIALPVLQFGTVQALGAFHFLFPFHSFYVLCLVLVATAS